MPNQRHEVPPFRNPNLREHHHNPADAERYETRNGVVQGAPCAFAGDDLATFSSNVDPSAAAERIEEGGKNAVIDRSITNVSRSQRPEVPIARQNATASAGRSSGRRCERPRRNGGGRSCHALNARKCVEVECEAARRRQDGLFTRRASGGADGYAAPAESLPDFLVLGYPRSRRFCT